MTTIVSKRWFYESHYGPTVSANCGHSIKRAQKWLDDARASHMSFPKAKPMEERLVKVTIIEVYTEEDLRQS
jgi:hypothetical protein